MQLIISGRGIVLSRDFKDAVTRKVARVGRLLPALIEARATFTAEKFRRTRSPHAHRAPPGVLDDRHRRRPHGRRSTRRWSAWTTRCAGPRIVAGSRRAGSHVPRRTRRAAGEVA